MSNKKTAIEWLEDNLNFEPYDEEEFISNNKIWQQAKAMEKEQIKDAFKDGFKQGNYEVQAIEFYSQTYKKQDNEN